jgi:hypothetical protein
MLSRLKTLMSGAPSPAANTHQRRLAVYQRELDEPEYTFRDPGDRRIDVHAFGRDFVPDCEEGSDEGYVLLTNGMSEQPMAGTDRTDGTKARAELMWYVREATPELSITLRWLATVPFIDNVRFGFGHRVPMPAPPVVGTDFRTFLFLTPIIQPDQRIAEQLSTAGEPVEILTVNLISDREYELIRNDGLEAFLDLLDENDYPPIFDPARKSYV